MKLIVVRHGETEENSKKIMTGQTGGKLTEQGGAQAKKLAERLKNEKIDFIYSSDLLRTKETLREVLHFHTAPVIYDPLLREKSQGVYDGRPLQEYLDARSQIQDRHWRPEGGENFYDVKRRVRKFIKYLQANHQDTDAILVVTHGGWKNILLSYLLDIPRKNAFFIDFQNTAVTIIDLDKNGKHKVKLLNCTNHL